VTLILEGKVHLGKPVKPSEIARLHILLALEGAVGIQLKDMNYDYFSVFKSMMK
jgi:hypothetical protein